MHERPSRFAAPAENLGIVVPDFPHHFVRDGAIAQGSAEIGRTLKHGEVSHLFGNLSDELNRRSAGSNDTHPLTGQVHALLWPASGVAPLSLVSFQALEVGNVVGGKQAHRSHQEGSPGLMSIGYGYQPRVAVFLEGTVRHPRVKPDVWLQVKLVCHVVQVPFIFRLARIKLLPVPLPQQLLREGIPVAETFRIKAGAGVAVPIPGSPHSVAVLEHPHRHSQVPQTIQLIQSGNAGADHNCVKLLYFVSGTMTTGGC